MSHTPLPWKVVTPCPGECCWHLVPADFDESALRQDNWMEMVNLPEMSEADARLVAAQARAAIDRAREKETTK